MNEQELVEQVLKMREVGLNASKAGTLPFLFREIYGIELQKCEDCILKAWETIYRWAVNRNKPKFELSMSYRIKKEYEMDNGQPRNFVFLQGGKRIIVNYTNLTDERAEMMLRSEYAHAIEGQPDKVVEETPPNLSEGVTASTSENQKADGKPQVGVRKKKLVKL